MKCICNPHLVPGDTAQRPLRTGEGVSGARSHGAVGEAGGVTVLGQQELVTLGSLLLVS